MRENRVLVGTFSGLYSVLRSQDSSTRLQLDLADEWITSISPDDDGSAIVTTRAGGVYLWNHNSLLKLASLDFRVWFADRKPGGGIVVGGSHDQLVYFQASDRSRESLRPVADQSGWISHSGSVAHVNSYVSGSEGSQVIGIEVGGVARRDDQRWVGINKGLDPDVHKILRQGDDLLASTGTGVYLLRAGHESWDRMPPLPLSYAQGLVLSDGKAVVSSAAKPFGRHLNLDEFDGRSSTNQFGVFRWSKSLGWTGVGVEGGWTAGILSKALAGDHSVASGLLAGDLNGRLFQSEGHRPFRQVADGFGPVECVASIPCGTGT